MDQYDRVAVIVPAHNEEADIVSTLITLTHQSFPVHHIVVVCDNCTDQTAELAQSVTDQSQTWIDVVHSCGNRYRKAGALNTGIDVLRQGGWLQDEVDFVLTMDGDTDLDHRFVEHARLVMNFQPNLGGVSAAPLGKPGLGSTPWQKLLIKFQEIEYSRFAFSRIRSNVHTMSGAGSFYRARALDDLISSHGRVFSTETLVEDYVATLELKEAGWRVTTNQHCMAHTDMMPTMRRLIGQRERWVLGTIDVLRRRGWTRHTAPSIVQLMLGGASILYTAVWSTVSVSSLVEHGWHVPWPYILLLGFWSLYASWGVHHMGWRTILMEALLIPELLFGFVRNYWLITSTVRSYGRTIGNMFRRVELSTRVWKG